MTYGPGMDVTNILHLGSVNEHLICLIHHCCVCFEDIRIAFLWFGHGYVAYTHF